MERVVITGATSMLGLALIEECIAHKTQVLAIVRPDSLRADRLPSSKYLETAPCALSELERFAAPPDGAPYDVFYHFAWQGTGRRERFDPSIQLENVRYTLDAVRLAARLGCRSFIGAGSQAEYGRASETLSPETPVRPETAYGIAKYAAGGLGLLLAKELGLTHIWARVFSVYGPGDMDGTMIQSSIRRLLAGERPQVTRGEQLWDYLYSGDAADAFYRMGESAREDAVYCLGSGEAKPLRDYIEILRDVVDPEAEIGLGELEYAKNQVMFLCADIKSLTRDTGFRPRTDFRTGIEKTIKWTRENKNP